MTNSHLEEFPQYFLNKIANIKMIYLESNLLSELPSDFFDILRHLQWFDIRNNRLKSLPSSIKNHSCLETIMLQGNLLEKLPLELGLIPKLKTLHTSGNPLSYPSTDILNKGFSRIIQFLREEWNKLNPNEQVFSPSAGSKMIKSSSTDFSNNLSTISKLSSGSYKQLKTTSSVSTLTLSSKKKKLTTREKSRNYKPSNRCRKIHNEEFLEEKLRWILKVKEILIEQSKVLQQNKNQDALNLWRMKRKNIDKNIEKASSRTEEDIPFAIDIRDMPFLKTHKNKKLIDKKKASFFKNTDEIDTKMREIFESLKLSENRDQNIKNQGPDLHLNVLKSKIKKIEELYSEIQKLKRFNTTTISKNYNGPNIEKEVVYKLLPSMII
ncbi:hypothetical protein HCN44_010307 [Aphidius gifuensis]|uniref:Leucine-rich repeat-containing protein 27 n=2 Tax=Aphidius gifuensis TaxID=684658 RepID=A0A834XXZ4_APHGI|nr:hypothetical protein HCN44_010307 [Aphidius gifuensis]